MNIESVCKKVFTATNFKEFVSGFPKYLVSVLKDPTGKSVRKVSEIEAAELAEVLTAITVLTVVSVVGHLINSWSVAFVLNSALLTPIYMLVGMLVSFVLMLMLGFQGTFRQFIKILVLDVPVFCAVILIVDVSASLISWKLGLAAVTSFGMVGVGLACSYRFLKICGISQGKILIALGLLTLIQVGTVVSAVKMLGDSNSMASKLKRMASGDVSGEF